MYLWYRMGVVEIYVKSVRVACPYKTCILESDAHYVANHAPGVLSKWQTSSSSTYSL